MLSDVQCGSATPGTWSWAARCSPSRLRATLPTVVATRRSSGEVAELVVEQVAAGAGGHHHDGYLRVDADGRRQDAGVGDEEPGHIVALAVRVDHRGALVHAHAA